MNNISIEKQIKVINTIVNSLDELVALLKVTQLLSEQIMKTNAEILIFLKKALVSLPELLVTSTKSTYKKQDLVEIFDEVMVAWDIFPEEPEIFFDIFSNFSNKWKHFESTLLEVEKQGNTIFLSMN